MTTSPVATVTDELLEELEQLASKATPGPWWIDSHGHHMVSQYLGHETVFIADDKMGPATRNKETGNLSHWPNDWDASFIAMANPATILALLNHIRTLNVSVDNCELFRKDAERYQWLRNPETDPALVIDKRGDFVARDEAAGGGYYIYEYRAGEELDAAIDAAMAASHSR